MQEAERALEILRARKASFDRFNDNFRRLVLPFAGPAGGLLIFVIVDGLIKGEVGFWPVLFGIFFAGVLYLFLRINYSKDATPADYILHHIGYSRSDGAILGEQIAEHERRLENLRRDK